jgi:hypothetical protein
MPFTLGKSRTIATGDIMNWLLLSLVAAALLVSFPLGVGAPAAERKAGRTAKPPGQAVTAKKVKDAVRDIVTTQAKANNGLFTIRDESINKEWRLKLAKVRDPVRRFEKYGKTIYAASAAFKAAEGEDLLDIDFWLTEEGGKMVVIDVRIYRVNGTPRFTYEGIQVKELR